MSAFTAVMAYTTLTGMTQDAQAGLQGSSDEVRPPAERQSHRDREREDPLTVRRAGQDVVDEVGGGVFGAAGCARRADAAALARERHEQLVAAGPAADAREAAGEDAAAEEPIKLASNPRLDGVSARWDVKKPFAILAEMAKGRSWRARMEDFWTGCRAAA